MKTSRPTIHGLWVSVAVAMLTAVLIAVAAPAAQARTSSDRTTAPKSTLAQRAAQACSAAKRANAGNAARKRCTTLRRQVAAAARQPTVAKVVAPEADAAPGEIDAPGAGPAAAPVVVPAAKPAAKPTATTPAPAPAPAPPTTTTPAPTTATTPAPAPAPAPTTATTPAPAPAPAPAPTTATTPAPAPAPAPTTTDATPTPPPAPTTTTATPTPPPATTTTTTTPTPPPATAPAPGTRLYSASSPFNTRIPANATVAPNSTQMMAKSVSPYIGNANFANNDWWGISMVNAKATDPMRQVTVFDWGYGGDIAQPSVHVPDGALPTKGDDHHLAVFDGDKELDMWVAEQQSDSSWKAGARTVTTSTGTGISSEIGGNAAGFALAAGVIRPEEIAAGRIEHALQFTSPYVRNTYVKPAIHGDGRQSDVNAMPMGTRIQLDPDYDISNLSRVDRIIAQAFKDYGAYLADSSGSLAIRGEASIGRASQGGSTDIWTPVGVTDPSLRNIPWTHMRVVLPS